MVHGLASQLGGALTIDSRPGCGARVELWLPESAAALERALVAPAQAPLAAASGVVLLVDDEEAVRMSAADMLSDLGYAVVEAASAKEALRRLDEGLAVDLLVTDHLMQDLSGVELARQALARQPGLRVLIVSGFAEVEGIDPELPRLAKPFRQGELASALARLTPKAAGGA
jgi:CheY-like chemotaxis protein